MNGLVLDTSALLAYASGKSVEPGAMLTLTDEDPRQQVWIPALCLGQAYVDLAGSPATALLDLLVFPSREGQVAVFDAGASRRAAHNAVAFGVPLDVAHAVTTALLYRCYLLTRVPALVEAAAPPDLEILDISGSWE